MILGSTNFITPVKEVFGSGRGEVVYSLPDSYNDDNPMIFELSSNGDSSYSVITDEIDIANVSVDMRLKHTGDGGTKYSNVIFEYSNGTYGSLRFKTSPTVETKHIGNLQFTMENELTSATGKTISSSSPIYFKESEIISATNPAGIYNDYTLTILNQNDGTGKVSIEINGVVPNGVTEGTIDLPQDATLVAIGVQNDRNPVNLSLMNITDLDGTSEPPETPTNLSASSTLDGKINLSWNRMENAISYNVLVTDDTNEYLLTSASNEIQLEDLDGAQLVNGNTYTFAVQGVGRGGISQYSTDDVHTKLTLAKVENLSFEQFIGRVALQWEEVSGATSYKVYVDNKLLKETGETKVDVVLDDEDNHEFKVISVNNAGDSNEGFSNAVITKALPITEKPGIPTNVKALAGNGKVTLRWEQSIYASNYVVYQDNEVVAEVSANELSYTVEDLINEQEYTFAISAKNSVGESDKSEKVKATPIQVDNPLNLVEGAWLETAYATWSGYPNATGYNVYWKEASANDLTYVKVDDELVRGRRVDVLGLKGNVEYTIKVVAIVGDEEDEDSASFCNVIPTSHDRQGFAFAPQSPLGTTNGGYNDDGTVKENANIIYVTEENKNTVTLVDGGVTYTGLKEIFPKGARSRITQPLIVRFIGTVSTPEGLSSEHSLDIKETKDITFEGVGSDALIEGYGITSNKSTNVVIRNLTFSEFIEDAVSIKGPSTNNWVSNNTFLVGAKGSGDKAKGDGSTDTKDGATYFTVSYNHYVESGKSQLAGATSSEGHYTASYHHNWYDRSGSRHPRVRAGSVHVFNNYYSGVTTYGVGASINSSVFVENNYFENTKLPMIMSGQGHSLKDGYTGTGALGGTGSDDMLSSEGNAALRQTGNYLDEYSAFWFDEEYDTGDSKTGSHKHNLFHENISTFYTYNVQTPEVAREQVMRFAGVLDTPNYSVPPSIPENVSATLNEDLTFTVIWDLQTSAKNYELVWSNDNGATYKDLVTTEGTRFTTTETAEVGKTYLFKVRGVNDAGESGYSEPVTVAYVNPSTPTDLVITEIAGGFALTWKESTNASSYDVTISNNEYTMTTNVAKNSFSTNELASGTYGISIIAKNGDLSSDKLVGEATVLGLIKRDDLTTILWEEDFETKTVGDTVDEGFNPSDTVGSNSTYNAVEYTTTEKGIGLKLVDKSNSSEDRLNTTFEKYLDEEITSGRVSIKLDYQLYTTTTSNSTKPLIIKDSTGKVLMEKTVRGDEGNLPNPGKMNWSELEIVIDLDNKVYDLYTDGDCIYFNQPYDSISAIGVKSIGGATPSGAQSGQSNAECSTIYDNFTISIEGEEVDEIDNTPTNVKATNIGKTELTITWSEVDNATSYNVYEVNEDEYTLIGTTETTSYTVTGLMAGTTYKFVVTAIVEEKESDKSSILTTKTVDDNEFDAWKRIISGSSTNLNDNSFIDEADGSVTIESLNNKGKVTASDLGTAFQYGEVLASDNFTFKTNAVASIYPGASQQSFGIMLRDENGTHGSSSAVNANYIGVGAIGGNQNEIGDYYRILNGNLMRNATGIVPAVDRNYELTLKKEGDIVRLTMDDGIESETWLYDVVDLGLFTELEKTLFVGMYTARTATVNYSDFSLDIENNSPVSELTVETLPKKVQYYVDDQFEKDGIVVRATFEDGSSRIIEKDFLKFENFDSSEVGTNTMKVIYGGKEASFDVEIINLQLVSMYIKYSPSKVKYLLGDSFSQDGLVVEGLYNSGEMNILEESEYTITGFDNTVKGTQVVTITYNENESITTSFIVTIVDVEVTGIAVSKVPNKTSYFLNEEFDLRGLEVVTLEDKIVLDSSDYDVSGFDSQIAGLKKITVTYKGFKTTFFVTVEEKSFEKLAVTKYPTTTVLIGEDLDLSNLEISRIFDNGDVEVVPSEEYTVDSSEFNKNIVGVYAINVTLIDDVNSKVSFNVTVREAIDAIWKTAIFGQSSNTKYNFFRPEGGSNVNSVNSDTFAEGMSVLALEGGGKVTSSHDGMSFYYTEVNGLTDNFVISADVIVNNFAKPSPDNQEGFGLAIRDTVGEYEEGTQPINASNMIYIGGYRGLTQAVIRKGVDEEGGTGDSSMSAIDLNKGARPSSSNTNLGEYRLSLSKTNSGFYLQLNDNEPVFYGEPDIFTVQDDTMYIGFFAARLADITIKNLEFSTSNAETDEPKIEQPEEAITPTLSIVSLDKTATSEYPLKLIANVDGKLVAVDDNQKEVVVEKLKGNEEYSLDFILEKETTNFTITFTPDSSQNLNSYEKIVKYFTVTKKDFEILGDKIFVSPTGVETGTGERENPLDLVTAINFVKSGQTIVMLEGTYVATDVLNIPRGNNGTSDKYKSLVADTDAKVTIDMNRKGNFNVSGNYWHLYGIDITNATGGLRIGGSYNIIELVNTYDNGDTGLQISRTDSTQSDISLWPSYNLILNCTSYNNRDASDNNADGFASKLTSGVGNVFRGCIAHNNVDDGWDLYAKSETGPIGAVLIDNSIAYNNGTMVNGEIGKGDKNGFKLGGEGIPVKHTITNSIAFGNGADGFTSNSNPDVIAYNNISYNNNKNLNFYTSAGGTANFTVENFISYNGPITTGSDSIQGFAPSESVYLYNTSSKKSVNSQGVEITDDLFVSLIAPSVYDRDNSGNIIFGDFLKLVTGFDTIDGESNKVNNLKVSQVNNNQLKLRWDGVAGATGYEVYYKSESMTDFELYGNASIAQIIFEKTTDELSYEFKVRCIVNGDTGTFSEIVVGEFTTITIDEVTNIKVEVADSDNDVYKISWDKVDGGLSYIVSIRNNETTLFTTQTVKNELLTFIKGYGEFEIIIEAIGANNISSEATFIYTIDMPENLVTGIEIKGNEVVTVGTSCGYQAIVTPDDAENSVIWSIESGEELATIDKNGKLTAFATGVVIIKATAIDGSEVYATFEITIDNLVITDLETAIEAGKELVDEDIYTKSSREFLNGVINSTTEELQSNEKLTQNQLNELELLVNKAIEELVVISMEDKNRVVQLIDEAEELINSHTYMDNGVEKLQKVVDNAKVYVDSFENGLYEDIANLLENEMEKLILIPVDVNATDDRLNELLLQADDIMLSKEKYSLESINNLENTLTEVRQWLSGGTVTYMARISESEDDVLPIRVAAEELTTGTAIVMLTDAIDNVDLLVNKENLMALLEKTSEVEVDKYTESTGTKFTNASGEALVILQDNEVKQEDVLWAEIMLTDAYNNLVDISELKALVEEIKELDESLYTLATMEPLQTKLLSSEIIVDNGFGTKNVIEEWVVALKELLATLELEEIVENVDKTLLEEKIKEANEYEKTGHTEDSWSKFETALNEAIAVFEKELATSEEVANATVELSNAINNLRADKTVLEKLINDVDTLKESDYTKETWTKLMSAYDKAGIVNNNEVATVEEVFEAIKLLEDSINSLELVKIDNTNDTGNPYYVVNNNSDNSSIDDITEAEELEEVTIVDESEIPLGTLEEETEEEISVLERFKDFEDISSWAKESFEKAIKNGFITGYNGNLNPKGEVTRAEFLTMILKLKGVSLENNYKGIFTDVNEDDWYAGIVEIGYNLGYINGIGNGKFAPNDKITRQDMVVIINNVLALENVEEADFNDKNDIAKYASQGVANVVASGIMTGVGNDTFAPNSNATREMAVTVIINIFEMATL